MSPTTHAFVSIENGEECYACDERDDHPNHHGHEPRPDDMIGSLCALVTSCGLTMTLYGKPVTEAELRDGLWDSVVDRIADRMAREVVSELELPVVFSDA